MMRQLNTSLTHHLIVRHVDSTGKMSGKPEKCQAKPEKCQDRQSAKNTANPHG
jgi:hypothetical protein